MPLNTQSTMLAGFLTCAEISGNCPTDLSMSMTVADKHTKELKAIESAGCACRCQAAWIGLLQYAKQNCCFVVLQFNLCRRVPQLELDNIKGKHMVEILEQLNDTQNYDHLKKVEFVCIGHTYFQICAPEAGDNKMCSCIFWTKESPEDNDPHGRKLYMLDQQYVVLKTNMMQIGDLVYGVQYLKTSLDINTENFDVEYAAALQAIT